MKLSVFKHEDAVDDVWCYTDLPVFASRGWRSFSVSVGPVFWTDEL